jgi:hypothetical protein
MKELEMSHALLFTQNDDSRSIGGCFYGGSKSIKGYGGHVLFDGKTTVELDGRFGGRFPGLRDFEVFGDRIAHILRKMEDWKPRTFRELFIYGYKGRFEWWVAMFGVFVGVVSILVLAMGIWATVAAQKQYDLALKEAGL